MVTRYISGLKKVYLVSIELMIWSLGAASIATGLVAGVFLSFSDFTMRSMKMATPEAGSQVMQILNREVFRSIFIVLLIGMSAISAASGIAAYIWPPTVGALLVMAGSLSFVLGVFLATMLGNVPKNEKLAALPDGGPEAQSYWPTYYSGWMFWNHVLTAFSFITAVLYLVAAIRMALAV